MHPIKLGNRRLLKLADKLFSLPPRRFYYGHWVGENWEGHQDLSCGTTACAFGWAPSIPSFYRAGLRLRMTDDGPIVTLKNARVTKSGESPFNSVCHTLKTAQQFFSLTVLEADFLFVPETYMAVAGCVGKYSPPETATAKQVAHHIIEFVTRRAEALKGSRYGPH